MGIVNFVQVMHHGLLGIGHTPSLLELVALISIDVVSGGMRLVLDVSLAACLDVALRDWHEHATIARIQMAALAQSSLSS